MRDSRSRFLVLPAVIILTVALCVLCMRPGRDMAGTANTPDSTNSAVMKDGGAHAKTHLAQSPYPHEKEVDRPGRRMIGGEFVVAGKLHPPIPCTIQLWRNGVLFSNTECGQSGQFTVLAMSNDTIMPNIMRDWRPHPDKYEICNADEAIEFLLEECSSCLREGHLVDGLCGKPLQGLTVTVYDEIGRQETAIADANGRFSFAGCWPDSARLVARDGGEIIQLEQLVPADSRTWYASNGPPITLVLTTAMGAAFESDAVMLLRMDSLNMEEVTIRKTAESNKVTWYPSRALICGLKNVDDVDCTVHVYTRDKFWMGEARIEDMCSTRDHEVCVVVQEYGSIRFEVLSDVTVVPSGHSLYASLRKVTSPANEMLVRQITEFPCQIEFSGLEMGEFTVELRGLWIPRQVFHVAALPSYSTVVSTHIEFPQLDGQIDVTMGSDSNKYDKPVGISLGSLQSDTVQMLLNPVWEDVSGAHVVHVRARCPDRAQVLITATLSDSWEIVPSNQVIASSGDTVQLKVADTQGAVSVSLSVRDAETGESPACLSIECYSDQGFYRCLHSSDGEVSISALPLGRLYHWSLTAPDYQACRGEVPLAAFTAASQAPFTQVIVVPIHKGWSAGLAIEDDSTGAPIGGALAFVQDMLCGASDESGHIILTMQEQPKSVTIQAPGYLDDAVETGALQSPCDRPCRSRVMLKARP